MTEENKIAQPVQSKVKQSGAPPQQPQYYQSQPPKEGTGISVVTIVLSILVIILLISTIVSIAALSSQIDEINEELDDEKDEQEELSEELDITKSELNMIKTELNNTKDDLSELQDDYNDLEDDYDDLKDDYDELEEDYEELASQTKGNEIPHPSFVPETVNPYQTEVIRFDGGGSNDVDGEIIEYRWDFGNGDLASGYMVDYSYDDIGTYTVTLTVTDNNSSKNSTSEIITVKNAIIITVSEASQNEYYPEDYEIILTFKNNGANTAHTDEAYWCLKTVDGTLYAADYVGWANEVYGGEIEDFELDFDDVTGIPNKLIYNDPPYHQEVDIDI